MKLPKIIIKPEIFNQVANLIEFIISMHPFGFAVLLGAYPQPTPEEIHEMIKAQRDPLPLDYKPTQKSSHTQAEAIVVEYESFENVVKLSGGWQHINRVANELKEVDPKIWNVAADHVKYMNTPGSRFRSRLKYVADKHNISRNTAIRYRRLFPQILATMLLVPDSESMYTGIF